MDGSAVNEAQLNRVIQHLVESAKGTPGIQTQLYQENETFNADPNFLNYLVLIACNTTIDPSVRFIACLRIKAALRMSHVASQLTPESSRYLCSRIVTLLDETANGVRTTAGTLLADLASKDRLVGWTPAFGEITSRLSPQNPNVNARSGAMSALFRIWEDVVEGEKNEDGEGSSLSTSPEAVHLANITFQACIALVQDSVKDIRHNAIRASLLILENFEGDFITQALPAYLAALFAGGSADNSSNMCVLLCEAFSTLACGYFSQMQPHASSVFQFVSFCLSDVADDLVREKAADFVALFVKENDLVSEEELHHRSKLLEPFVPSLVPALFSSTKYTSDDIEEIEQQLRDDDQNVAVSKNRKRGTRGHDDDDDDDDQENVVAQWNHRKAAASALEQMGRVFRGPLFSFLSPLLTAALSDSDWRSQESAILVIGAVSFGCATTPAMKDALPQIIPFVVQAIDQEMYPLLRSTALWTAGCFAYFMLQAQDDMYFLPCVAATSKAVTCNHRLVQEAACSALATISEEANERMVPYIEPVTKALNYAVCIARPLTHSSLLDAITTFLECVGAEFVPHSADLTKSLVQFYYSKEVDDVVVSDAMYAIMALFRALANTGTILEIVGDLFYKTLSIIDAGIANIAEDKANNLPEDGQMVNAVATGADLIAVIFEVLGAGAEALLVEGKLLQRVASFLHLTSPAVLQSAHALIGDLSRTCSAANMSEFHKAYATAAARDLSRDERMADVATNVCWALGEMVAAQPEYAPMLAPTVIPRMAALFLSDSDVEALNTNIASTLGLFGMHGAAALADVLGDALASVGERWVYWAFQSPSSVEMYRAFSGLANISMLRPQAVFPSTIKRLLEEYPKIEDLDERVMETIVSFIGQYKLIVGAPVWTPFIASLSKEAQKIAKSM